MMSGLDASGLSALDGKAFLPYIGAFNVSSSHDHALRHRQRASHAAQGSPEASGGAPWREITVDKLPGGRLEMKAARPNGKMSEVLGLYKRENGPSLSIKEINEI